MTYDLRWTGQADVEAQFAVLRQLDHANKVMNEHGLLAYNSRVNALRRTLEAGRT